MERLVSYVVGPMYQWRVWYADDDLDSDGWMVAASSAGDAVAESEDLRPGSTVAKVEFDFCLHDEDGNEEEDASDCPFIPLS
jgi:hypothetical protein